MNPSRSSRPCSQTLLTTPQPPISGPNQREAVADAVDCRSSGFTPNAKHPGPSSRKSTRALDCPLRLSGAFLDVKIIAIQRPAERPTDKVLIPHTHVCPFDEDSDSPALLRIQNELRASLEESDTEEKLS